MGVACVRGWADLWQVFLFLFLAAIPDNLVDAEVRLVSVAQTNGTAHPADFLHYNALLKIPKTVPPCFSVGGQERKGGMHMRFLSTQTINNSFYYNL